MDLIEQAGSPRCLMGAGGSSAGQRRRSGERMVCENDRQRGGGIQPVSHTARRRSVTSTLIGCHRHAPADELILPTISKIAAHTDV